MPDNTNKSIRQVDAGDISGKPFQHFFSFSIIIFAFLNLFGGFNPGGFNWGFHHLAFYSEAVRISIFITMLLLAVPVVQRKIVHKWNLFATILAQWSTNKKYLLFLSFFVIAIILFWFFRARTTFLGDGFWLGFRIQQVNDLSGIPIEFKHEPLTGLILWKIYKSLSVMNIDMSALYSFQILSIGSGIIFISFLWKLSEHIARDINEKLLFFLFVFISGGTQLFFGYVENYAPAYAGIIVFTLFALQYLKDEAKLVKASLAFSFLYVLYFGTIVFVPALMFLFFLALKRKQYKQFIVSIIATPVVIILLLLLCGFTYDSFMAVMFGGEGHTVPLRAIANDRQAYTMFSFKHITDVINLFLLISPFVLIVVSVPIISDFKKINWKDSKFIFIFLLSAVGFVMISVFNCDIGMSRDWDLLATFMLPIIVFGGYIWLEYMITTTGKVKLLIIVMLTMLGVGPWIALNSNGEKAAARFNILLENTLWGKFAFKVYEELAIYYRDRGDYQKAEIYYQKFLAVDSTNPRIYGNLADLYQKTGDSAKEIYNYEQAVKYGTKKPEILLNLGIRYGESGRYLEAIEKFNQVLIIDPHRADILNAKGTFILRLNKDYKQALTYFLKSIEIDKYYSLAYLNAGLCYEEMDDKNSMKIFYSKFLQMVPDYPGADSLRNKIKF